MAWHEITWDEMKRHAMTWNENDMTWNHRKWHETTWNEMKINWHEIKWNNMKWKIWKQTDWINEWITEICQLCLPSAQTPNPFQGFYVKWSSRCSLVHILPCELHKTNPRPLRMWQFLNILCGSELSLQSPAYLADLTFPKCSECDSVIFNIFKSQSSSRYSLLCTFCRQQQIQTKTLLRRPRKPLYPKQRQGFGPERLLFFKPEFTHSWTATLPNSDDMMTWLISWWQSSPWQSSAARKLCELPLITWTASASSRSYSSDFSLAQAPARAWSCSSFKSKWTSNSSFRLGPTCTCWNLALALGWDLLVAIAIGFGWDLVVAIAVTVGWDLLVPIALD